MKPTVRGTKVGMRWLYCVCLDADPFEKIPPGGLHSPQPWSHWGTWDVCMKFVSLYWRGVYSL